MDLLGNEKKDKNEIELKIGINADELDKALNKAYLKNRKQIGVPGFRKGKAPRKVIEKMYGISIFMNDALDDIMPEVMHFAREDTEFDIVGYPKVSDINLKDNDTRAEITLIAALRPDVVIKNYKGLKASKPSIIISDSEIDKELDAMRERNARIETVERPVAMGDTAVIDFEGFIDGTAFEGGKGKNYDLELGSGAFILGFEEKLEGMSIGEERDIDLVFPENYKENLAGKPVVFRVKLHEIKEKQLPDLDDDFAMDVSEFDTLDEYKADIRRKLEEGKQAEVDGVFEDTLILQITESMEAEIPEAMIEEEMNNASETFTRQMSAYGMQPAQYLQMTGTTPEEFKSRMRENAEKKVKITLALEEIAKLEGFEISEEEYEEEYKLTAEQYKIDIDKVKETISKKDVAKNLKLRKAANIVRDTAIAVDGELKNERKSKK